MVALVNCRDRFMTHADLLEQMGGDALDIAGLKVTKRRLIEKLTEKKATDLAECIQSQRGHYGLIFPR